MTVVCLCVRTSLIDKYSDENFPGGSHPHPLHISLAIYFYFIPRTVTSLASKKVVFTFGSDLYDFFFALLTMQILIEHHFKECEKLINKDVIYELSHSVFTLQQFLKRNECRFLRC